MNKTNQEKVSEIIAQDVRHENFISFPSINISEVNSSSLGLFNDVISKNIKILLNMQELILKEILSREKEYRIKYNVEDRLVESIRNVLKETNEKLRKIDVSDTTKRCAIRLEANCEIDKIINSQFYKSYPL